MKEFINLEDIIWIMFRKKKTTNLSFSERLSYNILMKNLGK